MYNLKAFMCIDSAESKTANGINAWGELSTQSLTYSVNKLMFSDTIPENASLIVFHSTDGVNTGVIPLATVKDNVFDISKYILYIQTNTSTVIRDRKTLLSNITNHFSTVLSDVNIGDLVTDSTAIPMPEWIEFKVLNTGGTFIDNISRIWYSDASFQTQYDEATLVVVPPLGNIDDFFLPAVTLLNEVTQYNKNIGNLVNAIRVTKASTPESNILNYTFNWVDPNNVGNTIPVNFTILLYGRLGNEVVGVKNAIMAYLKTNSIHSIASWSVIFPDIFKSTGFYIYPRWGNYAIAERVLLTGQYSTVTNVNKELVYIKKIRSDLGDDFINKNLMILPTQFKSILVDVIGGNTNDANHTNILNVFPDLLNTPTTDVGFDLMNSSTKEFLINLVTALKSTETIDANDALPDNMSLTVEKNILYLTFSIDNINYLVSTKKTTPGY